MPQSRSSRHGLRDYIVPPQHIDVLSQWLLGEAMEAPDELSDFVDQYALDRDRETPSGQRTLKFEAWLARYHPVLFNRFVETAEDAESETSFLAVFEGKVSPQELELLRQVTYSGVATSADVVVPYGSTTEDGVSQVTVIRFSTDEQAPKRKTTPADLKTVVADGGMPNSVFSYLVGSPNAVKEVTERTAVAFGPPSWRFEGVLWVYDRSTERWLPSVDENGYPISELTLSGGVGGFSAHVLGSDSTTTRVGTPPVFCPACGSPNVVAAENKSFRCRECGDTFSRGVYESQHRTWSIQPHAIVVGSAFAATPRQVEEAANMAGVLSRAYPPDASALADLLVERALRDYVRDERMPRTSGDLLEAMAKSTDDEQKERTREARMIVRAVKRWTAHAATKPDKKLKADEARLRQRRHLSSYAGMNARASRRLSLEGVSEPTFDALRKRFRRTQKSITDTARVADDTDLVHEALSYPKYPSLKRFTSGNYRTVYLGKFGRFHAFSAQPSSEGVTPQKGVMSLSDYEAAVKSGAPVDPIIDQFDIPHFLTKIDKAMSKINVPKSMIGACVFCNGSIVPGASGWKYIAEGANALIHLPREPSKKATDKYAAYKGPRSPHTLVHEFGHCVFAQMTPAARKQVADYYQNKIMSNPQAARKSLHAPTNYALTKAEEWFCECLGYSIFGTERVHADVLKFLSELNTGGGVKDNPVNPVEVPTPPEADPDDDVLSKLTAAGLPAELHDVVKGVATNDDPQQWSVVFKADPGQSKTWRDSVRELLDAAGFTAAGSTGASGGGGSSSLYTKNGVTVYVNHKYGLAVSKLPAEKLAESDDDEGAWDDGISCYVCDDEIEDAVTACQQALDESALASALLTALRGAGKGEFTLGTFVGGDPRFAGVQVKTLRDAAFNLRGKGLIEFDGKNRVQLIDYDINDEIVNEVSPPGFSGTVRAMLKKHPDKFSKHATADSAGKLMNPYAIAWSLYMKGARSHYAPDPKAKGMKRWISPKAYKKRRKKIAETIDVLEADSLVDTLADSVEWMDEADTLHLQGIGKVYAVPADKLQVGYEIIFNYGYKYRVLKIKPVSTQFVEVDMESLGTPGTGEGAGTVYARKFKRSRLVGVSLKTAKENSLIESDDPFDKAQDEMDAGEKVLDKALTRVEKRGRAWWWVPGTDLAINQTLLGTVNAWRLVFWFGSGQINSDKTAVLMVPSWSSYGLENASGLPLNPSTAEKIANIVRKHAKPLSDRLDEIFTKLDAGLKEKSLASTPAAQAALKKAFPKIAERRMHADNLRYNGFWWNFTTGDTKVKSSRYGESVEDEFDPFDVLSFDDVLAAHKLDEVSTEIQGDYQDPANQDAAKKLANFVIGTEPYVARVARPVALYKAKGTYKEDEAHKLATHIVTDAARTLHKSKSEPWHKTYNPATRELAQRLIVRQAEKDAAARKYDSVLPKRYQKGFQGYGKPMKESVSFGYESANTIDQGNDGDCGRRGRGTRSPVSVVRGEEANRRGVLRDADDADDGRGSEDDQIGVDAPRVDEGGQGASGRSRQREHVGQSTRESSRLHARAEHAELERAEASNYAVSMRPVSGRHQNEAVGGVHSRKAGAAANDRILRDARGSGYGVRPGSGADLRRVRGSQLSEGESLTAKQLSEALADTIKYGTDVKVEPPKAYYDRWIKSGNTYSPSGPIEQHEALGRFGYRVEIGMRGPEFNLYRPKTDELYTFDYPTSKQAMAEVDRFWSLKENFKKLGLLHNRGILFYGPPGSGKTSLINQIAEAVIERGDVVFYTKSVNALSAALSAFRQVEPDRKVMVVIEEADELVRYEERAFLNLLDGDNAQDGVLYLASTNYIDRFPPRMLRPGRFDKKIFVDMPPYEGRLAYLHNKLKTADESADEIRRIAKMTDGLSFGDLRELIVGVYAMGEPVKEVIARLRGKPIDDGVASSKKSSDTYPLTMSESIDEGVGREARRRARNDPNVRKQADAIAAQTNKEFAGEGEHRRPFVERTTRSSP